MAPLRTPPSGSRVTSDGLRLATGREAADPLRDTVTPEVDTYAEGDLIDGKYRLLRKLGEGGMGAVWVAQNEGLDIKVAIKLIGAGHTDKSFVARLNQEAQAAARLGHPAIIRVFDFGKTPSGAPFIAMELLHGEDLASALERRGSLSERKAVQTILPVIHALAAAHDKGIVHRDLKPANIFLARSDAGGLQPKLLDFGVAKLDRVAFERLTRDGTLVGSPAYMSPEQARGEDVDRCADVWAVCVVLYEMIAGTLPFHGENYNRLLWAIAHEDPRPTTTQFAGDPKLWAILERGFRKRRAQRWESMRELGLALASWLHDQGVREDIAGVSLQTSWLERYLSGADLLAPEPGGLVARARTEGVRATISTLPAPRSGGPVPLPLHDRLRRPAVLGTAVLAAGAVAWWVFASGPATPSPEAVRATSAPAPAPSPASPTVPSVEPLVTTAPPPLAPAPSAGASSEPEPPPTPRTTAPARPKGARGALKNPFDR